MFFHTASDCRLQDGVFRADNCIITPPPPNTLSAGIVAVIAVLGSLFVCAFVVAAWCWRRASFSIAPMPQLAPEADDEATPATVSPSATQARSRR